LMNGVNHHKIIAGTLHFCEIQIHLIIIIVSASRKHFIYAKAALEALASQRVYIL